MLAVTDELGVRRGTVRLVPHSAAWQSCFDAEKQALLGAVGQHVREIRHIGSTAVPGIYAKPIIDIMAGLWRLEDVGHCISPLERLGYIYMGEQEIPGWHFFMKSDAELTTHHLHVVQWGSEYWESHLLFQAYLIQHPEIAYAYERLKIELARRFASDRESYTRSKTDFINKVTEMAERARYHARPAENGVTLPDKPPTLD